MTQLAFYGIREPLPGARWQQMFRATWAGYRSWYLSEGDAARPSLGDAARPSLGTAGHMLHRYMPELVPTWEQLVALTGADTTAARMLTLYDPPRFLPGCSQVVLTRDQPVLIRNYDYRPDLCERVAYSSAFTGRRVIGSSDCLWGLLDGMNDAGLVISLTAVPSPAGPTGFAIPLVVRYVLEMAESVPEAIAALSRVPINMAYNLTLLDRRGDTATVFVAPGARPEVFASPAATNHRGRVPDDPAHARSLRSVERQRVLLALLARNPDVETMVDAFLRPPLYVTDYGRGFGTMYTAVYRPDRGVVDYVWPGSVWRRDFDSPDAVHPVAYPDGGDPALAAVVDPQHRIDAPGSPVQPDLMCSREQLDRATTAELAELAEAAVVTLARSGDPAAFGHLLRLTQVAGESLGTAARALANQTSWTGVADVAGTTRQAAWERWRAR
jgi:predicted choloylglycine hydrolase